MKEKIKLMSIGDKKMKKHETANWDALIEEYAPNMYETIHMVGEEESIKSIIELRPEIVLLSDKIKDALGLLKKIKQIQPSTVILVLISEVDDEQETIDEFMTSGAYKCYLPPIVMDTLIHDMYVSLNLE